MFEELTYVCLDVPEPVASQVLAIRRAQRDRFRAALPAEITIAGSGGVGEFEPAQDPDRVFRVIDAIAANTPPIPASFGAVIRFPGTDIFAFMLQDEAPIRALHRKLAEASIRWRPARFDFTPHCTLRSRSPVTEADAAELLASPQPDPFVLDTLSVYEIRRDPSERLPVICELRHRVRLVASLAPNVVLDDRRDRGGDACLRMHSAAFLTVLRIVESSFALRAPRTRQLPTGEDMIGWTMRWPPPTIRILADGSCRPGESPNGETA